MAAVAVLTSAAELDTATQEAEELVVAALSCDDSMLCRARRHGGAFLLAGARRGQRASREVLMNFSKSERFRSLARGSEGGLYTFLLFEL